MYETYSQPKVILICLFCGIIFGVVFDFLGIFKKVINKKIFSHIIDFLGCVICSLIFLQISFLKEVGNFRLYTLPCSLVGFAIYYFSFHKIIAFLLNKVYNIIKIKFQEVERKYDGAKKTKSKFRNIIGRNNACDNLRYAHNVSTHERFYKKR